MAKNDEISPEALDYFRRVVKGTSAFVEDPEMSKRALNGLRSILDQVIEAHANLALCAKNESAQLSAIKTIYEMLGISGEALKKAQKAVAPMSAEKFIKGFMGETDAPN